MRDAAPGYISRGGFRDARSNRRIRALLAPRPGELILDGAPRLEILKVLGRDAHRPAAWRVLAEDGRSFLVQLADRGAWRPVGVLGQFADVCKSRMEQAAEIFAALPPAAMIPIKAQGDEAGDDDPEGQGTGHYEVCEFGHGEPPKAPNLPLKITLDKPFSAVVMIARGKAPARPPESNSMSRIPPILDAPLQGS